MTHSLLLGLRLQEEDLRWQSLARELAQAHLRPLAAAHDQQGTFPAKPLLTLAGHGFMGIHVSQAYGGAGAGVTPYSLAVTEIAQADASVGVTMSVTNMVCEVLEQFGTPEQRTRFIPPLTSGQAAAGSFCLSEPGSGSDASAMTTKAERTQEGWVLQGNKAWITSGPQASVFLTWAQTLMPDGSSRVSAFVVPADAPGISLGKPEQKMGQHASHTVAVNFDQVQLPHDALLGELGQGFRIAMMALDGGRIGVASLAVGLAKEALHIATTHLPRPSPATALTLARLHARVQAAHLLALRAASRKQAALAPFTQEAAMAKLYASETATLVTCTAQELLGPSALVTGHPLERLVRDARVTRIYEGTSEIQRIVIARGLLGRS